MRIWTFARGFFATGVALSLLSMSGCQADRFNDDGCVSDRECRADRICESGRCISPRTLDREQYDAGHDTADIAPTPQIERFLGIWDMTVSGEARMSSGEVDELEPMRAEVEIVEDDRYDLRIQLPGQGGDECPRLATLQGQGFIIEDEGCILGDPETPTIYEDVGGEGILDEEGILTFDYHATARVELPHGEEELSAEISMRFEGPRVQAAP